VLLTGHLRVSTLLGTVAVIQAVADA